MGLRRLALNRAIAGQCREPVKLSHPVWDLRRYAASASEPVQEKSRYGCRTSGLRRRRTLSNKQAHLTMWYFYALFGPATWALLNLDKYLLGRFFKENAAGPVLVVFTGFAGAIVAITIVLVDPAVLALAPGQAFSVMGAGALLVASYIPYMI